MAMSRAVISAKQRGTFSGNEMAYEVSYDNDSRVDQIIALKK